MSRMTALWSRTMRSNTPSPVQTAKRAPSPLRTAAARLPTTRPSGGRQRWMILRDDGSNSSLGFATAHSRREANSADLL